MLWLAFEEGNGSNNTSIFRIGNGSDQRQGLTQAWVVLVATGVKKEGVDGRDVLGGRPTRLCN